MEPDTVFAVLAAMTVATCGATIFVLYRGAMRHSLARAVSDFQEQIYGLTRDVVEKDRALGELHFERQELGERLKKSLPVYNRAKELRAAIWEMNEVWNGNTSEAECERVLRDNLWVLAPEYIEFNVPKDQITLSKLAQRLFGDAESTEKEEWIELKNNNRPDVPGLFWAHASLQYGLANARKPTLLVIELKKDAVSVDALEQVHSYAHGLMQLRRKRLWGNRIDCLVIGRRIDPNVSDVHLRWGPRPHDAIHITPLTYATLLARAELIYDLLTKPDVWTEGLLAEPSDRLAA